MAEQTISLEIKINGNPQVVKVTKDVKKLNKATKDVNKTTTRGTIEQDKLMKGTAGSKNATTDFAKQAQGMGGLVHVYATIAANVWALTAAFDVLKKVADITIMAESSRELSKQTGVSYGAVAESMKKITGGAINLTEAMRQANLALSGGASFTQVEGVTKIATQAANALGLSVPDAVSRMIQAVTKGEPELVDELGIILRVTKATEEYAASINTTAEKLTTFQKQQAILNQLLTQGEEKFGAATPTANPYAILSASVFELTEDLIKMGSSGLGPIVKIISQSTLLMTTGFAFVAKSLVALILPNLITTASAQSKLATTQREASVSAVKGYQEQARQLKLIESQVNSNLAAQQRLKGAQKPAQFFSGLQGKEGSTLFASLNKRKGPGAILATIMRKGLAKGLSSDAIFKQVKDSKVLKTIGKAIEQGDSSIFKESLTKGMGKKGLATLFSASGEDLGDISKFDKAATAARTAAIDKETIKTNQLAAAKLRLANTRKEAFETGKENILQHNRLAGSFGILSTAVRKVNLTYALGTKSLTVYEKALRRISQATQIAKLGMASFVQIGGQVISKLFGAFALVSIGVTMFKSFAGAVGLTTEAFAAAAKEISSSSKEIEGAETLFGSFTHIISETPTKLVDAAQKWSKINNIIGTLSNQIVKLVDNLKAAQDATFLDKLFERNFSATEEAIDGILLGLLNLKKISVDSTNFKPTVLFKIYSEEDQKKLSELNALRKVVEENEIRVVRVGQANGLYDTQVIKPSGIAEQQDELIRIDKQIAAIDFLREKSEELNLSSSTALAEQLKRIADQGGKVKEVLTKAIEQATETDNKVSAAAALAKQALVQIDTQITEMTNKSESRRLFTIDSSIGIRDRIKDLENASLIMSKFADSEGDVKAFFNDANKSFREAFFTAEQITKLSTASGAVVSAAFKKVRQEMDLDIDTIRNLALNLKILSTEARILKDAQKRGDLSTFQKLFDNKVEGLDKKIESKNAELRQAEKQVVIFGSKDEANKKLNLIFLNAELTALREKLRLQNETTPGLQKQLVVLERIAAVQKAYLISLKEEENIFKSKASLASQFGATISIQAKELEKQIRISEIIFNNELSALNNAKKKIQLYIREMASRKAFVNIQVKTAELATLDAKKESLKLKQLDLEIKKNKELFNVKNLARGQIGTTGFANSFAGFFDADFWADTSTKFSIIANDMALKIGNSVDNMSNIIVGGIENVTGTLVDALLSRTWDGKEEGKSFGHALKESLKATLRSSIGESIKANMTQAVVQMLGGTQSQVQAMAIQVTNIQLNTAALNRSTTAYLTTVRGSSSLDSLGSLGSLFMGSSVVPGIQGTDGLTMNLPMADGGVVHKPTNALIGEGSVSEAVVPLPNNRSIPVQLSGDTGTNVQISQSFDFRGADANTEARLRQMASQIKHETTKEIFDSINRGGSAAKAVGRR